MWRDGQCLIDPVHDLLVDFLVCCLHQEDVLQIAAQPAEFTLAVGQELFPAVNEVSFNEPCGGCFRRIQMVNNFSARKVNHAVN